ncbi:CesT family type III secretion system chaperone [Gammaproteobacteria bacterium]
MNELLRDFGRTIGILDLSFDEHHYCCLLLDDIVLNLELEEEKETLFLYAHLGALPREASTDFYASLLEGNFFHRQTAGGVLGMEKASGILVLAHRWPYANLTLNTLEKLIENFTNAAEYWSRQIAEVGTLPHSATSFEMMQYSRA